MGEEVGGEEEACSCCCGDDDDDDETLETDFNASVNERPVNGSYNGSRRKISFASTAAVDEDDDGVGVWVLLSFSLLLAVALVKLSPKTNGP